MFLSYTISTKIRPWSLDIWHQILEIGKYHEDIISKLFVLEYPPVTLSDFSLKNMGYYLEFACVRLPKCQCCCSVQKSRHHCDCQGI